MSDDNELRRKVQYVYLGNLSPKLQVKFLDYFQEAQKNGVKTDDFVEAWNYYAYGIEEHVFMTETPGTGQVPGEAVS